MRQPSTTGDPEKVLRRALLHEKLHSQIDQLTEHQQTAFWCDFDGLTSDGIAGEMGLTLGAAKGVLYRARRTLRMMCEANGVASNQ